ncbi:MAG: response regulator [Candidatus Marinimicrobia bacterium]|nr:response regulator [Candidatus Neomarinimicrobiota bacterium]
MTIYKDILIIDDSIPFCESIYDLIDDETDWTAEFVDDGEKGIEKIQENDYNIILLDLKMPGISGLEVLNQLDKLDLIKSNYIIVLTGEITIENAVDSLQFGAKDFIQKPTVVEYPDIFIERIKKGFDWQEERIINEQLKKDRLKAIEESQLIVKSVGHDMSGSYYGSLLLRLQTLNRKISKINTIVDNDLKPCAEKVCTENENISEHINNISKLGNDCLDRSKSIIELMKFFKELGEKLKHLGNAISIDSRHRKNLDLSKILRSAVHVFADSKIQENPNVHIEETYFDSALTINASEEDLIRVFLNLIENAYKAMDGKGNLAIKTWKKGKQAFASIEDTGCGIPEEKLDKIWRPDYTHWKNKTGTGLGLLICRKAIENSQGEINVSSVLNEGTTFTVTFKIS